MLIAKYFILGIAATPPLIGALAVFDFDLRKEEEGCFLKSNTESEGFRLRAGETAVSITS
jgi:hypothetical protein